MRAGACFYGHHYGWDHGIHAGIKALFTPTEAAVWPLIVMVF